MSKRWKPTDRYYYVTASGDVHSHIWEDDYVDKERYEFGNCFETKEQAEDAITKIRELLLSIAGEAQTSSAKLPKLTAAIFNHPACPEWAQYAVVDKAGRVFLFPHAPSISDDTWSATYYTAAARAALLDDETFDATDWKNSMIERPKESFPKLTEEIFNRPDCPKWAEYAAVEVEGLTYWYQYRPLADERIGVWSNLKNKRQLIPQFFDSSDWQNSLIERPKKSFPKLTEEVFDRPDCPEWAKYAAVGNSGYAYWFKDKPLPGVDKSTISMLDSWVSYGIKQLITGLWDSSDWQNSLIERTEKNEEKSLPDWCKVGEWAYSTVYDEYSKIRDIDEFEVTFDRGAYCSIAHASFVADYKQARPRPYNAKEMQKLVGKALELDGNRDLVTSYDGESETVYADSMWMNADELLSNGYTIDGKPCCILEHLENGIWVK